MINVNGLKRNAKNIVKKYSDAQIKVREATSNDPWGPSSTIMAEIADLTYNVVAFSEIMQMIWKRLNDHGKNWRHVYKALVVLEYLIKTGTEKVAQQCIENIFAIQTLKDFQFMEDNKDHGMNIREKSKKLVALLKDSEKLKAERARAIKAKSRLAEGYSSVGKTSIGSMLSSSGSSGSGDTSSTNNNNNNNNNGSSNNNNGSLYLNYHNDSGSSGSVPGHLPDVGTLAILNSGVTSNLDSARPQTASEEENQLKLALALSKEEADQQEKTRKNDEVRLKLALDVSKKTVSANLLDEISTPMPSSMHAQAGKPIETITAPTMPGPSKSSIDDLLGLTIPPPLPPSSAATSIAAINSLEPQNDPWSSDPWQTAVSNHHPLSVTNTPATLDALAPLSVSFSVPNQQVAPMLTPNPINLAATTISTSNNIFNNKRPMSKNPFED